MGKMERKSLPKEKFSAFERIFAKHGDIVEHNGQEIQNLYGNYLNLYGKMERKSLPKEKFSGFERTFAKHGDIVERNGREIQNLCGNFLNLYHVLI
jgi:hypothetical protein